MKDILLVKNVRCRMWIIFGTINLFQMGAEEVVSLDLNKTIYSHKKKLEN